MAATLLSAEILNALDQTLPNWQVVDGQLERHWTFPDFVSAWGFMTRVALIAQAMDHHPNWSNVYGNVTIRLSTHDLGGLSNLDVTLAQSIDRLD
ncbi:MAG: 4a-hydroxytetrahydrobiopterin dehydratase [Synechococcus sp.]|nr:4a-hydroxytetrahydrobiopterin dehydratase [Synechococcus sp.]